MCVGITPPCSKCGAPARYKLILATNKTATERILNTLTWIHENLEVSCPIKKKLLKLLEGKSI